MNVEENLDFEKIMELRRLLTEHGLNLVEDTVKVGNEEDADTTGEDDEAEELDDAEIPCETFEDTLRFLDDMVGMEHVKAKLLRLGRYVQWKKKLEAVSIDTSTYPTPNLTFMFLGEPGTGKTTVACRMGRILHSLGLLETRKVMEFRREDLMGENYGSEEKATKEALRRSYGSVFFLDEAYQCFKQSTDKRDPGYHILETMMTHFDKPGRCIIMAGYKNEMMELFKVNPGFRSRIPDDNIIEFKGASVQMLLQVVTNAFDKMEFLVSPEAYTLLQQHVHDMWRQKDKDFGNARIMRQLAETVVINHANRIMTTTQADDFVISVEDVHESIAHQQKNSSPRTHIGFV